MSKSRTCLLAAAVVAGVVIAVPARAAPNEMLAQMDTAAPKYNVPECQQMRLAAANWSSYAARNGALEGMLAYQFGIFGIIAAAGASHDAAKSQEMFVRIFIEKCGEEAFIPYFQGKAEKGDDEAAAWLGLAYAHKQDWQQAVHWYQAAADRGNVTAQASLGTLYAQGNGVPQDRAQAASLWLKAADRGSVEAQRSLGQMYAQEQNFAKAVEFYRAAAARRDGAAAFALAEYYEQGVGVARSDRAAFGWYAIAALALYPDAVARRSAVAARLTQAQIENEVKHVDRCFRSRSCNFD